MVDLKESAAGIGLNIPHYNKIPRQSWFTAYTCCDLIIISKDSTKPYKSITGFINQLADCLMIDGLVVRSLKLSQLKDLKQIILTELYK